MISWFFSGLASLDSAEPVTKCFNARRSFQAPLHVSVSCLILTSRSQIPIKNPYETGILMQIYTFPHNIQL